MFEEMNDRLHWVRVVRLCSSQSAATYQRLALGLEKRKEWKQVLQSSRLAITTSVQTRRTANGDKRQSVYARRQQHAAGLF